MGIFNRIKNLLDTNNAALHKMKGSEYPKLLSGGYNAEFVIGKGMN
jgi:hypothetical protein